MTTVLVFGTFDHFHKGHEYLLKSAREHGDDLVIILARDSVVTRLKGRPPEQKFSERKATLEETGLADEVREGDEEDGEYSFMDALNPDVVAFGYDQEALKKNFIEYLARVGKNIPTVTLAPFEPERYKSSLIQ